MLKKRLNWPLLLVALFTAVSFVVDSSRISIKPSLPSLNTAPPGGKTIRFAVIGDFGYAGENEKQVADMVKTWKPDFIVTTGDNNYYTGSAETIDQNIGQYYHEFIGDYKGAYGPGSGDNAFFPSLGNHDWDSGRTTPYTDYFSLPGNERYYAFSQQNIRFFALDSDTREPDGVTPTSTQGMWLKKELADSTACWNIVYFHHPPYSSGEHGSNLWMRWPYAEWGTDMVLSGHDHTYERLTVDKMTYVVNGLGGNEIYSFTHILPSSNVRFNASYGAQLLELVTHPDKTSTLTSQFTTITGETIDQFTLEKKCP